MNLEVLIFNIRKYYYNAIKRPIAYIELWNDIWFYYIIALKLSIIENLFDYQRSTSFMIKNNVIEKVKKNFL